MYFGLEEILNGLKAGTVQKEFIEPKLKKGANCTGSEIEDIFKAGLSNELLDLDKVKTLELMDIDRKYLDGHAILRIKNFLLSPTFTSNHNIRSSNSREWIAYFANTDGTYELVEKYLNYKRDPYEIESDFQYFLPMLNVTMLEKAANSILPKHPPRIKMTLLNCPLLPEKFYASVLAGFTQVQEKNIPDAILNKLEDKHIACLPVNAQLRVLSQMDAKQITQISRPLIDRTLLAGMFHYRKLTDRVKQQLKTPLQGGPRV